MAKWTNVVEERDGEYRLLAAMDPPHAKLFAKIWTGATGPLERIVTGVHWEYPEHSVAVIAGYHETVNRCRGGTCRWLRSFRCSTGLYCLRG